MIPKIELNHVQEFLLQFLSVKNIPFILKFQLENVFACKILYVYVLTTHRLAYLCCQCDASLGMKLALF